MDQTNFLNSPGFKIGAVDITTVSDHGGALPKKDIRLAVGVAVTGTNKNGKAVHGLISRIRYFGSAVLYYLETSPGRDERIHEVKPIEDTQGPSRTGELPKSAFQRMEPRYGPIGEKIMDWKTFNNMSETKDIIITLPKTIAWKDYQQELSEAEQGATMNFKVPFLPKDCVGGKCYIVHSGEIKGWMSIVGTSEKEFKCETTGKVWSGKFIERTGKFNEMSTSVKLKGFQGWRYASAYIK